MQIGVLSDTHGYLDDKVFKYFDKCDQVWHAGDIGSVEIIDKLSARFDLKAVFGNIDSSEIRKSSKEDLIFTVDSKKIFITHIAGKPYTYNKRVTNLIQIEKPHVLVCGHSHILRVEFDKKFNLLYMNPGACGVHGFHKVKTLLRFEILNNELQNMEAIELGARASIE